jgi:hypothetical protein
VQELHSLKDVISFTGVLTTAGLHVGQPFRSRTLKTVGDFVPSISSDARRSLGSLISALRNLPFFDLQAEIVGPSFGLPPFVPQITVHPSSGAIIETVVNYFKDGVVFPPAIPQVLANGTDISSHITLMTFNEPGHYEAVIARTGITSEGITTLVRRLPFTVGTPALPPGHHPHPHFHPSSPTCSVEFGLHGAVSSNVTPIRVFGGGFTPNEPIQIIEGSEVRAELDADVFGSYSIEIGFLHGLQPTHHVVTAHAVRSGLNSNPAGFNV